MVFALKKKKNPTCTSYLPVWSPVLYGDCRGGGSLLCMRHKLWFPLVLALSLSQQSARIHDLLSLFPPKSSWSEPGAERWPSPMWFTKGRTWFQKGVNKKNTKTTCIVICCHFRLLALPVQKHVCEAYLEVLIDCRECECEWLFVIVCSPVINRWLVQAVTLISTLRQMVEVPATLNAVEAWIENR